MFGLLVVLPFQSVQKPPLPIGVRAELLARNLPIPRDAADLDQPITSVADDAQAPLRTGGVAAIPFVQLHPLFASDELYRP